MPFQIFESGTGKRPTKVSSFEMLRDTNDTENIKLLRKKQTNVTGNPSFFGPQK